MTELNTPSYYAKQQKSFNAHIGDHVFIFQSCESHENGWNDSWLDYMNITIGHTGVITNIDSTGSFQVKTRFLTAWYPYFCLRIIR
jgi:hypothetical protein